MFSCISWERPPFTFCPGKKDHVFEKKIPSFQIIQERSCAGAALFGKTIFSESLKKISYFRVFFWERSSFIFRLRGKIIFSGKRNIIFSNNTKKIIFQRYFLGKTVLSGRLQKENMVFRAVAPGRIFPTKFLFFHHQKSIPPSLLIKSYNPGKTSFLAVVIASVAFCFNFILFWHTGHANFYFNSCSVFTECCSIEKGSNCQNQNHTSSGFHHPVKKFPQ